MSDKVRKIIFSKLFIIFFAIANMYFLMSNLPLLILNSKTPANTTFPLYHSPYIYDYNVYLSVITLGQNGFWLNRDAFTSEATKPGIFYIFYILVGKVSGLVHLWPPIAYHLIRIIGVELFLIALYFLTRMILGKKLGFWASIFSVIGTIAPIQLFHEKDAFITYIPWWKDLEVLKRLDQLPHHIFGQAMLLISLIFILKFVRTRQKKCVILSFLSLLIQGLILPPSLLPILIGLPATYIILHIFKSEYISKLREKKLLTGLFIILFASLIPLLISIWQTHQGYPWSAWVTWETARWNFHEPNFNRALLFSFGILPILSLLSIWQILKKRDWKGIFIIFWAVTPFLLLPFVNILGIGKIRLISAAPFVPFAILSVLSIFAVVKRKSLQIVLVLLFLLYNFTVTFSILTKDILASQNQFPYGNLFISANDMKSIDFIKENIPKNSVILSNEYIGNIIPAYAPVISYFGHINQTMDFATKQNNVRKFYSGEFSPVEAKNFLLANHISYVYFGDGEKMLGTGNLNYHFIDPLFEVGDIILYQVKI